MSRKMTYKEAGVDMDKGDEAVNEIIEVVRQSNNPMQKYVIGGIGGFAGLFNFGAYMRDKMTEEITRELIRRRGIRGAYREAMRMLKKEQRRILK